MLALALISLKIVLELFLRSCMNCSIIFPTAKRGQKIRASLSTDSELPKHITVYLDNSLTDEKYQLHLQHPLSHQKR